ncbi:MAG: VRR-NUC domain-containing protein [Oscillospiraceae bacterium]|nr:VRR-NUC domain-containing protein [Oscillospiraceae bacterium]
MKEHEIQNQIRIGTADQVTLFRTNAGTFWQGKRVYSKEFGQDVLINLRRVDGLPDGYSDLSGVRHSDGKAVFLEVKTPTGTVRPAQNRFIKRMRELGAIAGVCRSVEDAMELIGGTYHDP